MTGNHNKAREAAEILGVELRSIALDLPGVRQRVLLTVACVWQALVLAAAARARYSTLPPSLV